MTPVNVCGEPPKILVAEDEKDIRELVTFTLTFGGYQVIAAPNGAEAVEQASVEQPDLIILDVRMPKMTGYQACRALKENPETEHIPVAFLSAKGQVAEVEEGLALGAIAYILKPFAPNELLDQVGELLEQTRAG
jgi:CheY-like chemotaxis protein